MIQVAQEVDPTIDWRVGDAADLPYERIVRCGTVPVSAVLLPRPLAAVCEMARVVATGGHLALQTYAQLEEQPGYGPLVEAVVRHAGPEARTLLGTYWSMGDVDELCRLVEDSGLEVNETRSLVGSVKFPSVDALVHTEIQATPLAEQIGESAYRAVDEDARRGAVRRILRCGHTPRMRMDRQCDEAGIGRFRAAHDVRGLGRPLPRPWAFRSKIKIV